MRLQALLVAGAIAGLPAVASAADLVTLHALNANAASDLARAAVARCAQQGYQVSVTVVDRGGGVIAALRGDGANPNTFETARRKAWTALNDRTSSGNFAERAKANPGLAMIDGVITLPGGLVVKTGNEIIGAVGVAGAPGGDKDEACATAGIDAVRSRL